MTRTWLAVFLASGAALSAAGGAAAADAPSASEAAAPATQPAAADTPDLLGSPFESQSAGISLRIPAGCRRIQSTGAGDDLGQFADEKRNWQLKLNRISRPEATALAAGVDNFGKAVPGLMDDTLVRLKRDLPGCQVLRQDLTNIQDGDARIKDNVGMIAVRYTAAGQRLLSQQAIIQASDRLFFLISLTSPAVADEGRGGGAAGERIAVETFRQMLDSVRLLDTRKIALEQQDRLYHTRALMTNWRNSGKLRALLIEKQWLRVLKNGRDVGYSYITEQPAAGIPRPLRRGEVREGKSELDLVERGDGILVGVRSRSIVPPVADSNAPGKGPAQIDAANWLFFNPERNLEDWSRVTVINEGGKRKDGSPDIRELQEFGASTVEVIHSAVPNADPGTKEDPKQPAVRIHRNYTLNVTAVSNSGAVDPVTRDLPPFYLPQALDHLLPRLLPLERPRSYLFATYVPDVKEVMLRYVEVGQEQRVNFRGQTFDAVPITDRIGWHGSVTTHYMSPTGKYLGSENKETHLVIIPTDAQTLASLWKNANLTQPGAAERPATQRPAPSSQRTPQ